MIRSIKVLHPVITFVSANHLASQRAQELFCSLLSFQEISLQDKHTENNESSKSYPEFHSIIGTKANSTAVQCPTTKTIIHFLSFENKLSLFPTKQKSLHTSTQKHDKSYEMSLLAITDSRDSHDEHENAHVDSDHDHNQYTDRDSNSNSNSNSNPNVSVSIRIAREYIFSQINSMAALKMGWNHLFSRPITSIDLLDKPESIPLILRNNAQNHPFDKEKALHDDENRSDSEHSNHNHKNNNPFLREIVIPFSSDVGFHQSTSTSTSTLTTKYFSRPIDPQTKKNVIGLLQWPNSSFYLRPLPAAKEDRMLPSPSLVFQCTNLNEIQKRLHNRKDGISFAKVGFTGADVDVDFEYGSARNTSKKKGQLILRHPDFMGLDVRLCESTQLSSSFAEAQDSLLAGSLDDLQSRYVLAEGKETHRTGKVQVTKTSGIQSTSLSSSSSSEEETMNRYLGDCWVEFRANMKSPSGFFKTKTMGKQRSLKIAKAPDLPYE